MSRPYFICQNAILVIDRGQKTISSAPNLAKHIPAIGAFACFSAVNGTII
jgi:hypothetical protein